MEILLDVGLTRVWSKERNGLVGLQLVDLHDGDVFHLCYDPAKDRFWDSCFLLAFRKKYGVYAEEKIAEIREALGGDL